MGFPSGLLEDFLTRERTVAIVGLLEMFVGLSIKSQVLRVVTYEVYIKSLFQQCYECGTLLANDGCHLLRDAM